jgi:Dickkopf N-terminal cysteine-rich region
MHCHLLAAGRWRAVDRNLKALRSHFALFVLATSFGLACGTAPFVEMKVDAGRGDGGVTTPRDGGTSLDGGLVAGDACKTLNASRCQYLEACQKAFEATWCGPLTWPSHVAAGALRFDAVKAQSCAQAFVTQACLEWDTLPDSCNTFLKPRVPLGQPCYDGYLECADGVCRGNFCPRTCQPRAVLDETCTSDTDCRTGLFCRFPSFTSASGTCSNYTTVGGTCDGTSTNRCIDGLRCINAVCRELPIAMQSCLDGACSAQTWCDPVALDGGLCVARKTEGTRCVGDECESGLLCEPLSSTCQRLVLSRGDACTALQRCPAGTACLNSSPTVAGICEASLPVGASCTASSDCEAHLACLDADGGRTCQIRASTSASCVTLRDCRASAICQQGQCVELPLPSESCAETKVCRWGLCREVASIDGGAVCGALLSAGQACSINEQCASGTCDKGTCLARCVP